MHTVSTGQASGKGPKVGTGFRRGYRVRSPHVSHVCAGSFDVSVSWKWITLRQAPDVRCYGESGTLIFRGFAIHSRFVSLFLFRSCSISNWKECSHVTILLISNYDRTPPKSHTAEPSLHTGSLKNQSATCLGVHSYR
jgi:hypothetical protein